MRHILSFTRQPSSLEVNRASNYWSRSLKICVFVMWTLHNSSSTTREPKSVVRLVWKNMLEHSLCKLIRIVWRRWSLNLCWLPRICSILQRTSLPNKHSHQSFDPYSFCSKDDTAFVSVIWLVPQVVNLPVARSKGNRLQSASKAMVQGVYLIVCDCKVVYVLLSDKSLFPHQTEEM